MIILEGPDGAGKTTLLWRLHQETGIPCHERAVRDKSGPDDRDLWEWTSRDLASWGEQLYLYDRHPLISEYIYGPVTRGKVAPGFNHPSAQGLRHRMEQLCLVILCMPPFNTYQKNLELDEQMEGVITNSSKLYGLYGTLRTTWGGWLKSYDYTKPDAYQQVRTAVLMHAAQWRRSA